MRFSSRRLMAVAAIGLMISGLLGGVASAAPPVGAACQVAGPKPVDNPSYTEGTPLPELHDINLANSRIIVQTLGSDVTTLVQHVECVNGAPAIVDTPVSDTSVVWLTTVKGRDARGPFVEFTLAYRANTSVQVIQADQSVAAHATSQSSNPLFGRYGDGYFKYTTVRAYTTGPDANWVSAQVYVRQAGGVIFDSPGASANLKTPDLSSTVNGSSHWPKVRTF